MMNNQTPVVIEQRLLSSIKTFDDFLQCEQLGITADSFISNDPVDHRGMWEYINEHCHKYGRIPTSADLKTLFSFEDTGKGDLVTYATKVREYELGRKAKAIIISKAEQLDFTPVKTIKDIANKLSELNADTRKRKMYLDKDATKRLEDFKKIKQEASVNGIIGIPTGLMAFDKNKFGLRKGELVVVLGITNVGKSFLLMHMAVNAYEAGKRILLISPELTAEEQGYRFDTLLAGKRSQSLSNQALITGQLDEQVYSNWLNTLSSRQDFLVIDSSDTGRQFTYEDIWRYTVEYKPDEVLVDGLHLIKGSSNNKAGWEILKEGADYLKSLAKQEQTVVICSHQFNRESYRGEPGLPPGLDKTGYGFGVVQSANKVISLAADPEDETIRVYRVLKLTLGRNPLDIFHLEWDVDQGIIKDVDVSERF